MTGVLIKKGKSGHRDRSAQMEEDVKTYRNKAATYLQAKEPQGLPADTEARRGKEGLSQGALRESTALPTS